MDFDRWIDIVLMMSFVMLGVRVGWRYRSGRPDLIMEDTRVYNFVIWTPSVISAAIFIASNYFIDIFHARHICGYQEILNVLFFIFPKYLYVVIISDNS